MHRPHSADCMFFCWVPRSAEKMLGGDSGCAGAPFPPERSLHPRTTRGSVADRNVTSSGQEERVWPNREETFMVEQLGESTRSLAPDVASPRWWRDLRAARAVREGRLKEIAPRGCKRGGAGSVCGGRRRSGCSPAVRSIWSKALSHLTQRGGSAGHLVDGTALP